MDSHRVVARWVSLISVIVSCFLPLGPVQAQEGVSALIAQGGGPSHGWEAISFTTTASGTFTIDTWAEEVDLPHMSGVNVYYQHPTLGAKQFYGGGSHTERTDAEQTYIDVDPVGGVSIRDNQVPSEPRSRHGREFALTNLPAGRYWMLAWSSGDASRWRWTLTGDPNQITVNPSRTYGERTFMFAASDFRGVANVGAYPGPRVPIGSWNGPLGARAALATSVSIDIHNSMVAHYFVIPTFPPTAVDLLTVGHPSGTDVCQTSCNYVHMTGPSPPVMGPGQYTFGHSGGGVLHNSALILGGADAHLPD